jgi:NADP-dependent 3-hydroxy acid dehydrogenase YdfG
VSEAPVTLITGASTGIGAETARTLLAEGHRLVLTGRTAETLDVLVAELGSGDSVRAEVGDTTDPADVRRAVGAAVDAFGRLDNVVANAGFTSRGSIEDGDPDEWRAMLLTNVLGPAVLVQAALPALRESRGRIVIVGSVAGIRNAAGNMYQVTKWATRALAENVRLMVTGDGIGVTLIAPGRVDTPFWHGQGRSGPPPGPVLQPTTIADAIRWALSQPAGVDVNSLVVRPTGQEI